MNIDWQAITVKELAALISTTLKKHGIDAVLVGGACVTIYSRSAYLSYDLDFVSHAPIKEITRALKESGFTKRDSRYFIRDDCPFFLEFVAPPVALGKEPVTVFEKMQTPLGSIVLLTATDCVKDRLAAFYHWNDRQALEQACLVATARRVKIRAIELWSIQEGHQEKFSIFSAALKKRTRT